MSKASQLKSMILARDALPVPGVFDALSARLAEQSGFRAVQISGFAVAATVLGLPDIGVLSLRDQIAAVQVVCSAVTIPVMADGDTGFGNELNTYHAVRLLEAAGAAGVNLEDQTFPKRCGHMDDKSVIPAAAMIRKIRAAVDARHDPDFVINARTDAVAVQGLDAAIARANAYADAGADLVFIEAVRSKEEIVRMVREVRAPISVNMLGTTGGKTPPLALEWLRQIGVARVSYPILTLCAAAEGMSVALRTLFDSGELTAIADRLMPFDEVTARVGLAVERERERSYSAGTAS